MELISHHQPEEFRKGRKETPRVRPLPRIPLASIHLGWAMLCATRQDSELEWLAKDHPETKPITIPSPVLLGSLTLLLSTRVPFPIKSLVLSACVSSDDSFLSARQEPTLGALQGASPFLQQNHRLLFGEVIFIGEKTHRAWHLVGGRAPQWKSLERSMLINKHFLPTYAHDM